MLTLMTVHAHPDDEATSTGGVLARYAAEGVRTVLVTCTDGRCGDGPGGVKPGQAGHDPAAVVAMRRTELEKSAAILGVDKLEMLGYGDSGMMGWDTNDAPDAFWQVPVADAAARLADLMRTYQPDVVVTYDPNGFYGHPDHIQAHRITMAALEQVPAAKAYWTTVPRSSFEQFMAVAKEFGMADDMPDEVPTDIGLPDDQISAWVDTKKYGQQKYDALEAHASQSENIMFLRMGVDRFTDMMGVETYVRVQDSTEAALPEDDLFAGLR